MVKKLAEVRIYLTLPIPHHGKDIGVEILAQLLRESEISREEWLSA
jgi:hypothetical protein